MGKDNLGDISGSREPDPQAVPALSGFDPGRKEDLAVIVALLFAGAIIAGMFWLLG